MSKSKVTGLRIPARKRAANKLAVCVSSPRFMAVIDALLDICPRRTKPGGCDVLILKDRVYLVSEECDGEVIGVADDLIRNLNGIADVAGLDDEERAALLETVEEARVDDVLPEVERADPSA